MNTEPDILIFSPALQASAFMPMINAGLGAISGWLKQEGYDFDQRSLLAECREMNRYRLWEDYVDLSVFEHQDVVEYLRGEEHEDIEREANKMADMLDIDSYDVVLVSVKSDDALAKGLPVLKERAQDKLVVIGGSCTLTNDLEIARLPFIDYGVVGDGEIPLSNILEHELEGKPLESDTGLVYTDGDELVRGEPYNHPMKMKARPYFEQEIIEKMTKVSFFDEPIFPYQFSDGCTQDCSFCNYFENQKYQYKSVDKAVREIKEIKEETGISNIFFTDSNLFNDPDHVEKFAERMIEEDLDVKWGSQTIILPREQEFFDKLARAGCATLLHGIESASNPVLHRMRKAETRSMIEETLEKERKAGIKPFGFFITDFIKESWDEYYDTVDFFRQNSDLMGASINTLMIFRNENMPLYSDAEDFDVQVKEPDYDDYIEAAFEKSATYYVNGEPRDEEVKRMKWKHMRKTAKHQIFLKNFGRDYPLQFAKKAIQKLYRKDYHDYSWLYA